MYSSINSISNYNFYHNFLQIIKYQTCSLCVIQILTRQVITSGVLVICRIALVPEETVAGGTDEEQGKNKDLQSKFVAKFKYQLDFENLD